MAQTKTKLNKNASETDNDVQRKIASFASKNSNYLKAEKLSKEIEKADQTLLEQRQELYKEIAILTRTLVEKFDKKQVQKFLREKFHKTFGNSDLEGLNRVGRMLETHGQDNFDTFTIQNIQITADQKDDKIREILNAEKETAIFENKASTKPAKEFRSEYGIKKEETADNNTDDAKKEVAKKKAESNDIESKLNQTLTLLADAEELANNEEEISDGVYLLATKILVKVQTLNQVLEQKGKTEAQREQSEVAYSPSH